MMRNATRDIQPILARWREYEPLGESDGITLEDMAEWVRIAQAMAPVIIRVPPLTSTADLWGVVNENALRNENASLRREIVEIRRRLAELENENDSLRREVVEIRQRLAELEERMPEEKVIILRQIPKEQAKQEIHQLFSTGRALYYSDIAEELQLDLQLVVEICRELEEGGEVEVDDSV